MHGWTLYHFDNKPLQNPNWALQIGWRFRGTENFYFERTIGEIQGKVLPIDPQASPIWRWSCLDLLLQQYHIHRYLLLFPTSKVFCLRYFHLFLVKDLQVLIHLISLNDARIVFKPVKIADCKSTLWNWYFLHSDLPIKFIIQTSQMFYHLW